MKKTNITITGCMGRMGQQIIKASKKNKKFKIKSLTENKLIFKKIKGIKPQLNTFDAFKSTKHLGPCMFCSDCTCHAVRNN